MNRRLGAQTARRGRSLPRGTAAVMVLLAAGAISFYAFNEGLPFVHGYRISALMANSNALRPKSPVRIAGVTVGKVLSVSAGPGATTRVQMQLSDSALPIHTDATIRVRPRLFVEGGFYVALSPGSPSAAVMKDGATIPLGQTQSAVQLYQLLSTFDASTRASGRRLLATFAAALAHGGVKGLRRASAALAPALRDTAVVAQAAQGLQAHDLSSLVSAGARVTGTLAAHDSALAGLVVNLNTTSRALASQDGALTDTISQLDSVVGAAPPALTAVDRVLPRLARFSRILDPGLKAAPSLLHQLSSGVAQFGAIVEPRSRRRLVAALRAALVDFPTLVRRLTDLLTVVKPVTDCVRTHIVPILSSQIDDGALSTHRPVWQDAAHALPGLASMAQNFDGNGYWLRYQNGSGAQTVSTGSLTGRQPGSSPIAGSRPVWVGRLHASDFQPNSPCNGQPVPSLASGRASAHLTATNPAAGR